MCGYFFWNLLTGDPVASLRRKLPGYRASFLSIRMSSVAPSPCPQTQGSGNVAAISILSQLTTALLQSRLGLSIFKKMRALHKLCGVKQNKNVGMWAFDTAQCVNGACCQA